MEGGILSIHTNVSYDVYIEYFITTIFICAVYGSKINIIYKCKLQVMIESLL